MVELAVGLSVQSFREGNGRWTREKTFLFLEEKGPTGSGFQTGVVLEGKGDQLKQHVIAVVTAITWSSKVSKVNMRKILKLWGGGVAQECALPPQVDSVNR